METSQGAARVTQSPWLPRPRAGFSRAGFGVSSKSVGVRCLAEIVLAAIAKSNDLDSLLIAFPSIPDKTRASLGQLVPAICNPQCRLLPALGQ